MLRRGSLDDAEKAFERASERGEPRLLEQRNLSSIRALNIAREGNTEGAVASLRAAIATYPEDRVQESNSLAWRFAEASVSRTLENWNVRPEDEERVRLALEALVEEAVCMAEYAVERDPQATHWNTLGASRYRAGDLEGSLHDFSKSMELKGGGNADDGFFVAMAHHRLGDERQARAYFERAVDWVKENLNWTNAYELLAFRAEAAELLGIEGF